MRRGCKTICKSKKMRKTRRGGGPTNPKANSHMTYTNNPLVADEMAAAAAQRALLAAQRAVLAAQRAVSSLYDNEWERRAPAKTASGSSSAKQNKKE